ncbi:MAG TPA: hypothetical protein VIS29_16870 [Streptomyces sp.]
MLVQLASTTDSLTSRDVADLRCFLILAADPRDVRGLRYPAVALLVPPPRPVLGFAADGLTGLRPVPHAATVRCLLQRADGDALDAAIGAFLQAGTPRPAEPETKAGPVRRVIAVGAKVVRGSRTKTATAIRLPAATGHHGVVLARQRVASKSNEIPSFAPRGQVRAPVGTDQQAPVLQR